MAAEDVLLKGKLLSPLLCQNIGTFYAKEAKKFLPLRGQAQAGKSLPHVLRRQRIPWLCVPA